MENRASPVVAWWPGEHGAVTGREDWDAGTREKWTGRIIWSVKSSGLTYENVCLFNKHSLFSFCLEMIDRNTPTLIKRFQGKQPVKRNNCQRSLNFLIIEAFNWPYHFNEIVHNKSCLMITCGLTFSSFNQDSYQVHFWSCTVETKSFFK